MISKNGGTASSAGRWYLAMAAILLIGLVLRLWGVGFGLPALNDPDELMFELGAFHLLDGPTLNPGWFGHPATTTIYLLALIDIGVFATGFVLGHFASPAAFGAAIWVNPAWVILPGRVAMALFGTWAIWLTWRLACALMDRRAAMMAALLVAVSPLLVTWSQVVRSDVMATCFMLLCLLACTRILRGQGRYAPLIACFWLACAIATKWPMAIAGSAVATALIAAARREGTKLPRLALRLSASAGVTLAFLVLISPFLVLDHAKVLLDLQGEAQVRHLGATGGGLLYNAWWYLSEAITPGIGICALALACLGALRLGKNRDLAILAIPPLLIYMMVICVQNLVWTRWCIPIIPLLCLLAAYGFSEVCTFIERRAGVLASAVAAVVLAAIMVTPLVAADRANALMRLDDTRQQASRWAEAHIAPGSTVLVEHFAFDLLPKPWTFLFPIGEAGCRDVRTILHGRIGYKSIDGSRGGHSNLDYGTLPARLRSTCSADYAILTQYDRYAEERSPFPIEYAAYEELLSRGRIVATFRPVPGQTGGPIVRIVQLQAKPQ